MAAIFLVLAVVDAALLANVVLANTSEPVGPRGGSSEAP